MKTATQSAPRSRTRIEFDLKDILSAEELTKFQESAKKAGAPNVTEHFLNITLRLNAKSA